MEQGQGYLDLRVSVDLDVDVMPVTKSGNSEDVIAITLIPSDGRDPICIEDASQQTEPLKLLTGKYKIVASSGEDKGTAAFDAPYYYC